MEAGPEGGEGPRSARHPEHGIPEPVVPIESHLPPTPAGKGCAKLVSIGCGGFLVLALALLAVLWTNIGLLVSTLEMSFVRRAMARAEVAPQVQEDVEKVLADYDLARREADLGFGEWQAAGAAFSRSPSAMVLGIWEAQANLHAASGLDPQEVERARKVFTRLARGAAEGKISADDLIGLLDEARAATPPGAEKPRPVDVAAMARDDLERFLPPAEKLVAERQVPEEPFTPDIAGLLRRDLWESIRKP